MLPTFLISSSLLAFFPRRNGACNFSYCIVYVPQASLLPGHIFICSVFVGVFMAKLLIITAYKDENLVG